MKYFPLRMGLCGILFLVTANLWAQQPPPAPKPATPGVELKPGQAPPKLVIHFGHASYVRPAGSGCVQVPPPIFHCAGGPGEELCRIEALVCRAINLGNFGFNTKKIADVLERGLPTGEPKVAPAPVNGEGAPFVLVAAGQDTVQAPNAPQPSPEAKQVTDELNRNFKMQADLLRALDIGAIYRPGYPYPRYPYGPFAFGCPTPGGCYNGYCGPGYGGPYGPYGPYGPGHCALVLTGRTGLELTMLAPQSLAVLNLPLDQGLYIYEVYPKTPAETAGFKKHDVLIEMDGKKVPPTFAEFLEKVFSHVKNNTPIPAAVLRAGQRVEVNGMVITDRRVLPPLPHECPIDPLLPQIIEVVPGINSVQPSTLRVRELRAIQRPGGITEYIWVDPTTEKK